MYMKGPVAWDHVIFSLESHFGCPKARSFPKYPVLKIALWLPFILMYFKGLADLSDNKMIKKLYLMSRFETDM